MKGLSLTHTHELTHTRTHTANKSNDNPQQQGVPPFHDVVVTAAPLRDCVCTRVLVRTGHSAGMYVRVCARARVLHLLSAAAYATQLPAEQQSSLGMMCRVGLHACVCVCPTEKEQDQNRFL